jgi:hypothetical protein
MFWREIQRRYHEEQVAESYSELATQELQRLLRDANARLVELKQQFPDWQMLGSLDPVYLEITKLEYERKHVIVALSKRGTREIGDVAQEQLDKESKKPNVATRTGSADLWRNFHDRFMLLTSEQRPFLRADRWLRVYCEYNLDRSVLESDLISKGLLCLLYRLESGTWYVSEGPSENFKARFEALATRAGFELGSPQGTLPLNFWLHSLCIHLRRTDSHELFVRDDKGGIITNACQSSATFCSCLEKRAIEESATAPERNPARGNLEAEATSEPPSAETSAGVEGAKLAHGDVGPIERLRDAILKKKARVTEIERILNRPP